MSRRNPLLSWSATALLAVTALTPASLHADTIGFWRFDEEGADDGAEIETAVSESNSPSLDGAAQGGPVYSTDVPGSLIQDPVSGGSWSNRFSQDCSNGNARVQAPNDAVLNSDDGFTLEFFIKLTGEPGGWHPFARRSEANNRRWQVDFDHNTQANNFGDIRTRWDTPDGDTNNVAKGAHIWIDTDTGSGNPDDYDDAEDISNDGDGENDLTDWHHVALTWDPELKQFAMFSDYEETGRKDLAGTFAHPDAALSFGKHNGDGYGLFIDEVRYSSGVLEPSEFLIAGEDSADSDGDGLPDAWEQLFFDGLGQGPNGDPDGDGLSNIDENTNTTNPTVDDTDGDGLNDGAEIAAGANPSLTDTDGDLLTDGAEVNEHSTNPAEPDSDGDGTPDGVEVAVSSDPNSAASKPADNEVYFVGDGRRWDDTTAWSDESTPSAGKNYFVFGGLANKLTNPRIDGASFDGDLLTVQGEGSQLGIDRPVIVPAITLTEGGALLSDGAAFSPEITGAVTVDGAAKLLIPSNGRQLTLNDSLEGSGDVAVEGLLVDEPTEGAVTLAGATNAFTGNWTIGAGVTLKVASAGAIDNGDVTLNDGGLDADYNINNPSGKLTMNGDSTTRLVLDQDHIFGGLFVGENDILALAQANGLATDGVFTAETFLDIGFPEEVIVDGGGSLTISLDSDGDGLADTWELSNFGDLSQDADGDPDGDTLSNGEEILAGSDPKLVDTDGDTLSDGQEVNELMSNPNNADTDGDGITDNVEVTDGTSPILADTDGDMLNDGDEITEMTLALNPDTDGDRYPDGIEVANGSDPLSAGSAPPLFIVRVLKSEGTVNTIDAAESLAAGQGVAEEVIFYQENVNFHISGNTYAFEGDTEFPFASNEHLSVNATGTFVINQAGTYSIGANSDDGFRIRIDGEIAVEFLAGRGTRATVGLVDLAAGEHQLEFDYFQGSGGASVELFISESPASIEIADGPLTNQDQFMLLTAGQPADDDSDGLPDAWEIAAFGDLGQGPDDDTDSDGLSNQREFDLGSEANNADTDGDGLDDGPEVDAGTELRIADTDGDGLADGEEVNTHNTSPLLVDTDGDRFTDSAELAKSKSPTDGNSFPTLDDLVAGDPVVHYNFDEGAGTSIVSDGTNTTAGTIVGENVGWLDAEPAPGGGSYLLLPQEGSYVDTNLTASELGFQGDVDYTAMAWMWAESEQSGEGPGDAMILGQPTGDALHLGIRGTDYYLGHWGNDIGGGTVTFQEWHHVAWKYENGVQSIHVDGQLVAEGTSGALDNDVNVLLGTTRTDQDRDFVGFIDDVRVYNESLGDADIAIIALAGSSGGGGPTDSDNDGQSDEAEALAGTDANDPTSVFKVTTTTRSDTGVSVSWSSVSGKSYDVEYSPSLEVDAWSVIGSVDNVTEATASFEDTDAARTANPAGFYRPRLK